MTFFSREITVSDISAIVFVPCGKGTPIHKNRPFHGITYNFGCESVYTFESGTRLICKNGDCAYLPIGSSYTVKSVADKDDVCGVYAVNFSLSEEFACLDPCKIMTKNKESTLSIFKRLCLLWKRKSVGFREECLGHIYFLISSLKKETANRRPVEKKRRVLQPALDYIAENYINETISVGELARLCSVSEQYLRRLFAAVFSVSPTVYIRNMRLSYAAELLSSGECSVSNAATLSGFNDIPYFSREFKKAYGTSPYAFGGSFPRTVNNRTNI